MTTPQRLRIAILGTGRLAWNLVPALMKAGYDLTVLGRQAQPLADFASKYSVATQQWDGATPIHADVVLLAVSDGAIVSVAETLSPWIPSNALVAHTSGSMPMSELSAVGGRIGVLYPMQIFTKDALTDFARIPVFVEAAQPADVEILMQIGLAISSRVQQLSSADRLKLHLGAVLVCNFTNYLYRLADELVADVSIADYEILIREHIERVFSLSPQKTQTGPAIRGDVSTIEKHLALLQQYPDVQTLYRLLSLGINPQLPLT